MPGETERPGHEESKTKLRRANLHERSSGITFRTGKKVDRGRQAKKNGHGVKRLLE